jgi:predicted metalloprotease
LDHSTAGDRHAWEGNRNHPTSKDSASGGGGGFGIGGGTIGIGTIVIALIGGRVLGVNPLTLLGILTGGGGAPVTQQAPAHAPPANDQARSSSPPCWPTPRTCGPSCSSRAAPPTTRRSWCCSAAPCAPPAARPGRHGPVLLPADQKVYIDLSFYETMKNRLGAPGDFAQAYVIAHEVGHHVQHELGITDQVDRAAAAPRRPRATP